MISTAEDVKRKAEEQSFEAPEDVALPSGLTFKLRRPRPKWWILTRSTLPSVSLAARIVGAEETNPDKLADYSRFIVRLISAIVVEPRVANDPGDGEIDPNWITNEDLAFLIGYAGGEIDASGKDLGDFRGQSGTSNAGTDGEGVGMPPIRSDGT